MAYPVADCETDRYAPLVVITVHPDIATTLERRRLDPAQPVLLTLAARQSLGEDAPRSILPHSPSVSPDSAAELAELLIRLNIAADRGAAE